MRGSGGNSRVIERMFHGDKWTRRGHCRFVGVKQMGMDRNIIGQGERQFWLGDAPTVLELKIVPGGLNDPPIWDISVTGEIRRRPDSESWRGFCDFKMSQMSQKVSSGGDFFWDMGPG